MVIGTSDWLYPRWSRDNSKVSGCDTSELIPPFTTIQPWEGTNLNLIPSDVIGLREDRRSVQEAGRDRRAPLTPA